MASRFPFPIVIYEPCLKLGMAGKGIAPRVALLFLIKNLPYKRRGCTGGQNSGANRIASIALVYPKNKGHSRPNGAEMDETWDGSI